MKGLVIARRVDDSVKVLGIARRVDDSVKGLVHAEWMTA